MPRVTSTGAPVIGVIGYVRDQTTSHTLLPIEIEKIRALGLFQGSIFAGVNFYWYAMNGGRIIHTRSGTVVVEVCTFTRPTVFTGNVPLDDWHESATVQGAIAKICLKENAFPTLYQGAKAFYDAHIENIRGYASPGAYGPMQASPTMT